MLKIKVAMEFACAALAGRMTPTVKEFTGNRCPSFEPDR
jgi:hypothetical protein